MANLLKKGIYKEFIKVFIYYPFTNYFIHKKTQLTPLGIFSNLDFTLAVLLISKGPKDTKTAVNSAHVPVWVCILTRAYTLVLFATTGENSIPI